MSTNEQTTAELLTTSGFRLSPLQEHLWSVQIGNENGCPRSVCAIRIEGPVVALAKVKDAVQKTIKRHEVLRTAFVRRPGMKIPFRVFFKDYHQDGQFINLQILVYNKKNQEFKRSITKKFTKSENSDLIPPVGDHGMELCND